MNNMEKLIETILNHRDRGNRPSNKRSFELRIRFDDKKEIMIKDGTWGDFCAKNNCCESMTFGDLFA